MKEKGQNIVLFGICFFATVVISFCNIFYLNRQINTRQRQEEAQKNAVTLCRELIEQNNDLYYLTNSFVKSGNISYFETYWEQNLEYPRSQMVNEMESYVHNEEEIQAYQNIRECENIIQEYEIIIMNLQIQDMKRRGLYSELTQEYANQYFQKYVERFSGQYVLVDGRKDAIDYLTDDNYVETIKNVNGTLNDVLNLLDSYQIESVAETDTLARRTIFLQFVSFSFVVLLAILLYKKNAKMKELRTSNEMIVSAIGDEYEMIGVADLTTYQFTIIRGHRKQWGNEGEELDYLSAHQYYLDHMVSLAYKDTYRRTIQPVNVLNKIENGLDRASCVFKDNNGQWLVIEFTKSQQYTKDKPVVTVTIKNAWSIMQQRKEQRQKDEILMQFSQEFFEVYVVDLNKGSYEIIRSAERYGNYVKNLAGHFEQLIELAIATWAKPDFASYFEQISDLQEVKRRFANGEKKIEFVYLSNDGKWKHLQCFQVSEYGEGNEKMIFALKDYNEEMQILTNEALTREAINDIYSIAFVCEEVSGVYRCLHFQDDYISFPEKGNYSDLRTWVQTRLHTEDIPKYLVKTEFGSLKDTNRVEVEFRIMDDDNNYHYYREHIIKVKIPSGERIIHLARNIDEEKANEILAAQQLEKELRAKAKELEMANLLAKKSTDLEHALAQAEKANEEKTKFLSNMSHDLRTPMNAILGMSQMAKKHLADSQKVERYLGTILSAADSMQGMINDVLDVHKIEKGIISLHPIPCDVNEFIYNYDQVFKLQASEKGQTFVTDFQITSKFIMLDPVRAKQVMSNLTTNALKYTPEGGHISVSVVETVHAGEGSSHFVFTIQDDGIGMSKDFIDKVYGRYEREKSQYTENIDGTGLGMSIVKNLIDLAEGEITIESERGKGTLIRVSLDLKHCQQMKPEADMDMVRVFPGKRILLVEDKRINAEIVKGFLEDSQIEIVVAKNGQEAVQLVESGEKGQFDLIFMDIRMPIMNGYEATEKIRALENETCKNIPIIAMSANSLQEDITQSMECGMNGHICKPIDMDEVFECLNHWLGRKTYAM